MTRKGSGRAAEECVDRAIAYIDERVRERPSLREIAQAARMSPYHFHRTFTSAVGESVHAYAARRALARAAWTLVNRPGASVTDVAMEFGYSSSSDFARAFKAAYAASPSEFQARPSPRALLRAGSGVAEGMAARTTRLPDLSLAFVRVFGLSRDHKSAMIEEAFARLYRCLAARGTAGGLVLGLTMDPPETLAFDRCRYYACIEARDGSGIEDEVSVARFPTAGDYACVDVPPGPGPAAPRFFGACAYLVDSWMPERRLESADRPFIELFSEAGTPCWRLLVPIAGKARNA